ncbi:coproporphyrinogen III oxidase family protein [Helicobacter didelphidarum]|uniref:Heme chaperone HemW n=1 Tax=Helicobacter didelphidarum TaxID=2040648 RepID=A0A3D8IJ91_9HELI|nr:radical SAM family heme chaperone HemW [Helicobacter didelphidarum]RDU65289.1 coproporphyrinogen III oxidase family protein [Helicobacter didelphidarum]
MHLYIHIPFCDSKCGYCAFFSEVNKLELIAPYFTALKKDLLHQLNSYNIKNISTIFIGGGTPNIVDSSYYYELFEILLPLCEKNCEINMESNPNLLKKSWLLELQSLGLNRLSMGVQSFFTDKLQLLERQHNQKDIYYAFDLARTYFDNISLDIIFDCVLDTQERLQTELESALNLGVNHLSAYSLSVDSHSRFSLNNRHDTCSTISYASFVRDFLDSQGLKQYEVSNYARNKKCLHNLGYWSGDEYLGIGASAVGRIGTTRYSGINKIESYIHNPLQKRIENLSSKELEFEAVFLGLRSEIGVQKELCKAEKLEILFSENMIFEKQGRIYANDFFLADSLALYVT